MTVQLKIAEDDNKSLQQALKLELESRMQLEGTVCNYVVVHLCKVMIKDKKDILFFIRNLEPYRTKEYV